MKNICVSFILVVFTVCATGQITTIGLGNNDGVTVTTSSSSSQTNGNNTVTSQGMLPNLNAASRFLSQASLGANISEIESVASTGIEDWIDQQFSTGRGFNLIDKVINYKNIKNTALGTPDDGAFNYYFDFAWWNYAMQGQDVLRQRIAFALSEFFVISRFSSFGDNSYALATYYDMLLDHSFGNYRELLESVTYHSAMGEYLTYMNNPKSNLTEGTFPDENYAREVMQLFSIGLCMLDPDGTCQTDNDGNPIPTYDNVDIAEFAKIFTGLHWGDNMFFYGPADYEETYLIPMQMDNTWHEPGVKNLLNGFTVPNRNPVNGKADIDDALDNLFNHQNVGPFLGKFLIQRLVHSNPSPGYVQRVTQAFNGQSQYGTNRGDMKALIKAILLDEEARSCYASEDNEYGMLREPFIRYVQMAKALKSTTQSGEYRNAMTRIYNYVGQRPFGSPSVFNFFQSDFQPIGVIEQAGKVAPEFQITNTQSISGYFNALNDFIVNDDPLDEWGIYDGENYNDYSQDHSSFDFSDLLPLIEDDAYLPQVLDYLNLVLAHGKLTTPTLDAILKALVEFEIDYSNCNLDCLPWCPPEGDPNYDPNCDPNVPDPSCVMYCENDKLISREGRLRIAIYLVMASPEYLINR